MGIRQFKPVTKSSRFRSVSDFSEITRDFGEKSLMEPLKKSGGRDNHGELVDVSGDVWTTLVDEYVAGPSGWSHTQHAWLFKRSRWTGRLDLAATIQTGIVE